MTSVPKPLPRLRVSQSIDGDVAYFILQRYFEEPDLQVDLLVLSRRYQAVLACLADARQISAAESLDTYSGGGAHGYLRWRRDSAFRPWRWSEIAGTQDDETGGYVEAVRTFVEARPWLNRFPQSPNSVHRWLLDLAEDLSSTPLLAFETSYENPTRRRRDLDRFVRVRRSSREVDPSRERETDAIEWFRRNWPLIFDRHEATIREQVRRIYQAHLEAGLMPDPTRPRLEHHCRWFFERFGLGRTGEEIARSDQLRDHSERNGVTPRAVLKATAQLAKENPALTELLTPPDSK